MATKFVLDGQEGWYHESGINYGYFHTYDDLTLDSKPRKIHIFLPKDYENKKRRYPVVYMNDGQTAFFPSSRGLRTWDADKVVDCLYKNNLIEPVIVVAVFPVEREYEYLSIKEIVEDDGRVIKSGGLDEYSDFIALKLKPFIDKNYNTVPDSSKTLIVGSSFGGVAAFYIGCKHSDRFGMLASLSPSFSYEFRRKIFLKSIEGEDIISKVKKYLTSAEKIPKIWLDWGMLEKYEYNYCPDIMLYLTRNFNYRLNNNLFYLEDPYGNHDEAAWSYRFNIIMTKFYSSKEC
jgi:predicted alpha/beta superfamily hydrolase